MQYAGLIITVKLDDSIIVIIAEVNYQKRTGLKIWLQNIVTKYGLQS